ncbi:ABC transporter substrate-binding protein [Blautia sp.]|uniref:ABC transporter substrate-binding protein n=1 Tax=Blautia sp. TaxID=1955243 RepID=UPI00258A9041|nr:ABC transporter substrate-binding protein [Blautia sp.]
MNKKVIAVGMAMVLASIGLAACSGSGSKEAKDSPDETYTVTMAYIGDKKEDTDRIEKKINEIMKKDINMELDIEPISWGAYAETMKLILSGGEKMDIVPILVDQANSMVNAKQVIDMSEYIDKYGDNIKELLGDTAKAANIGNYVYGVTTGREWFCQSSVIMRKDILDECGIDASSITDYKDLTDVYAIVKEKYPNMVMMASNNSTTPDTKYEMNDTLTDGFGVLMDHGQDTTVVDYYETDEYKEFVETMYDWQQKGYLSKDAATTTEGVENQVKAGAAFSYLAPNKPGYDTRAALLCGTEMEIAPISEPWAGTAQISFLTYGISSSSADKDKTMQCLDYLYGNADILNLLNWGEEGVDYEVVDAENNIINYPDGKDDSNTYHLAEGWQLFDQFKMHIWEGDSPDIWDETKTLNESAIKSKAFGFTYDSTSVANELAALSNVKAKYAAALGSGTVDPEETLPKFIEELKKAGIEKVISTKQEQLDKWLEENK